MTEATKRPCPFCGAKAYLTNDGVERAFVVCSECDAEGPWDNVDEKAVAAWNNRHAHDALVEALANMVALARPHFTDDAQQLALSEALAALALAKEGG